MYLPVNQRLMHMEPVQPSRPAERDSTLAPITPAVGLQYRGAGSDPRQNPWLVFLLPLVVFMVAGSFEPAAPTERGASSPAWIDLGIEYRHYPLVYSIKILLTCMAMIYVLPGYQHVLRQSGTPSTRGASRDAKLEPCYADSVAGSNLMAVVLGVLGTAAWIGLAWVQKDLQERFGWSPPVGARSGFNPLAELSNIPIWAYGFLAIRFIGLGLIVPVVEEMFLRGFLMRFFIAPDWWRVPVGTVNRAAFAAAVVVPVLMHPREAIAAAVWFSAVAWLLVRTRSIWSCILAHAVTNLLLGIYVVASGNWWLM
jgi:CAAX prenyl protease-like protein